MMSNNKHTMYVPWQRERDAGQPQHHYGTLARGSCLLAFLYVPDLLLSSYKTYQDY